MHCHQQIEFLAPSAFPCPARPAQILNLFFRASFQLLLPQKLQENVEKLPIFSNSFFVGGSIKMAFRFFKVVPL
jgi:hypothetical protein